MVLAIAAVGVVVGLRLGTGVGSSGMGGTSGMDMRPVDTRGAQTAPLAARGGERLEPTVVGGVKRFALSARVVRWTILPNVVVGAYAYNGVVPGPEIRVTQGERMRIADHITNNGAEEQVAAV